MLVLGPDFMEEGKQYILICHIINVTPLQNLKVMLYQGNKTVHTQIANGTSVTPVNVLTNFSVTADRDAATFSCEANLIFREYGPDKIPSTTSLPYTPDVRCELSIPLFIIRLHFL